MEPHPYEYIYGLFHIIISVPSKQKLTNKKLLAILLCKELGSSHFYAYNKKKQTENQQLSLESEN